MGETIYLFEEYPFYEGCTIIMASKDYDKLKKFFYKEIQKKVKQKYNFNFKDDDELYYLNYGWQIRKIELDKPYSVNTDGNLLNCIEMDSDGKVKILK